MLQLSFKQKLIMVVLLTLVGIAYLGYVSTTNLTALSSSSQKVSNLTATSDLLSSLQLELLSTENHLSQINEKQLPEFKRKLKQIKEDYSAEIASATQLSDNTSLKEQLQKVTNLFKQYTSTLEGQVEAQAILGFNNQSGLLKPLGEAASKLREQLSSFSMLLQPFIIARQLEKEYLIQPNSAGADKLKKQIDSVTFEVKDAEFYDAFGPYIEAYQSAVNDLTVAANALGNSKQKLNTIRVSFRNQSRTTQSYLKNELLSKARSDAASATNKTQWTIISVSFIVAMIICVMLSTTAIAAGKNLKRIITQLNTIAAGNLTQPLEISHKRLDEFDQVARAVNTMTEDLREVIQQVSNSQNGLYQQSTDLSHSIQTIAENNGRVSDQSNHLASATEQISATTEQVASRVLSLQGDSQNAHSSALEGGNIISQAMNSLGETAEVVEASSQQLQALEAHSTEIDKVLVIINDLADQTNLLALNAAIEAARAGEAGRGFSVVADEVRTLAESTVKATGDITGTVRAIQQQTRSVIQVMDKSKQSIEAVKLQGNEAQNAVERIEHQTQQAFSISTEITSAIEEVARTTREMANSMDQIAHGIELNSSASSEIVSSAGNLKQSAELMGQMTKKFSF